MPPRTTGDQEAQRRASDKSGSVHDLPDIIAESLEMKRCWHASARWLPARRVLLRGESGTARK